MKLFMNTWFRVVSWIITSSGASTVRPEPLLQSGIGDESEDAFFRNKGFITRSLDETIPHVYITSSELIRLTLLQRCCPPGTNVEHTLQKKWIHHDSLTTTRENCTNKHISSRVSNTPSTEHHSSSHAHPSLATLKFSLPGYLTIRGAHLI
jgi:hypothetical protein